MCKVISKKFNRISKTIFFLNPFYFFPQKKTKQNNRCYSMLGIKFIKYELYAFFVTEKKKKR